MCAEQNDVMRFPDLLSDPLIRLVMKSDGITEQEMNALMVQLRRALAAREGCPALRRIIRNCRRACGSRADAISASVSWTVSAHRPY